MADDENKETISPMNMILIGLILVFVIGLSYFLLNQTSPNPVSSSVPAFDGLASSYGFVDNAFSMFGKPQ